MKLADIESVWLTQKWPTNWPKYPVFFGILGFAIHFATWNFRAKIGFSSILMTDVGDKLSWWQLYDVGDRFGHFGHQNPLSLTFQNMSSTFKSPTSRCHQYHCHQKWTTTRKYQNSRSEVQFCTRLLRTTSCTYRSVMVH